MTRAPQTGLFHTIVWATDGSAPSVAGVDFVRDACERYAADLRIVHVAPPLSTQGDERRIAKLKAVSASLRRRGIGASLHVVRGALGSPAPHIAEVARMVHADLVIVTTRGRSSVFSALRGSTTLTLIAQAPCPVLALPALPVAVPDGRLAVTPPLAASA
jgi:nucleotide-binding universal stress UspA family protein